MYAPNLILCGIIIFLFRPLIDLVMGPRKNDSWSVLLTLLFHTLECSQLYCSPFDNSSW